VAWAWINFLRAKFTRQVSSKPIGAIRQGQFCHSVSGSMSVAGSGTGLRVILVCLIVRCTLHPNREFVGRGDLVDSLSSRLVTDSRLLPPRSGLERSDFVLWPISTVPIAKRLRTLTGVLRTLTAGKR
jgi:hypothetical protein